MGVVVTKYRPPDAAPRIKVHTRHYRTNTRRAVEAQEILIPSPAPSALCSLLAAARMLNAQGTEFNLQAYTNDDCTGNITGSAQGAFGSSGCVPSPGSNSFHITALGEDCVIQLSNDANCLSSVLFTGGGLFHDCFPNTTFTFFEATCG